MLYVGLVMMLFGPPPRQRYEVPHVRLLLYALLVLLINGWLLGWLTWLF